jgi:hypothetical protein
MNGDGFPDVITPGNVHFTDQRGSFLPAKTGVAGLAVSNQDLTISASGGLSVQLVDIKSNTKGKTNATHGSAAGKGGDANDSSGGVGIGGDISASWTSPNSSAGGPDPVGSYQDELADVPDDSTGGTAPIQIALADVNGDGLPDRVFTTPQGVFAQYNLGYAFTSQSVKITTGGFEAMESYAGTASLGFSTPWAEFSGGVALNWNYDQARYSWRDVNGDGILDQVHKRNGNTAPLVAFGTGSGMLGPVEYGAVESVSGTLADNGQQVSFDRSNGLGGGFDFTIYIGPICIVACYLVINPGASFQNSVSTSQVDLQDVNGDGYADSVSTTDDDSLWVRLNKHDETNLLQTVTNPLGGTIGLSYTRDGNTIDSPESTWVLSRVDVNDGRPGDGADITATTYEYAGLRYDRVHRQSLGFGMITARELDAGAAGQPALRVTTTRYHNSSVFTAGLERSVTTTTPAGALLRRATSTYGFRDVRDVAAGFDVHAPVTPVGDSLLGTTDSVASRGRSIAPLVTRTDEEWFENGALVQSTFMTFTYDGLGNVLTQRDAGETEDANDDLLASYVYSTCDISSTMDPQCPTLPSRPSPIFSEHLCPTWVSLPVVITVTNGKTGADRVEYRHRDGRGSICDNASITHLEERINGSDIAETELTYDEWGSYDRIVYPSERGSNDRGQPALETDPITEECIYPPEPDAEGKRYAVRYVYDQSRHSDIASVTEYVVPVRRLDPRRRRRGPDVQRDLRRPRRASRHADRRQRQHDHVHVRLARPDQDDQQSATGGRHGLADHLRLSPDRGRLRLREGQPSRHLQPRQHDRHVHVRGRHRPNHPDQARRAPVPGRWHGRRRWPLRQRRGEVRRARACLRAIPPEAGHGPGDDVPAVLQRPGRDDGVGPPGSPRHDHGPRLAAAGHGLRLRLGGDPDGWPGAVRDDHHRAEPSGDDHVHRRARRDQGAR